jgi:hypothetical protein
LLKDTRDPTVFIDVGSLSSDAECALQPRLGEGLLRVRGTLRSGDRSGYYGDRYQAVFLDEICILANPATQA